MSSEAQYTEEVVSSIKKSDTEERIEDVRQSLEDIGYYPEELGLTEQNMLHMVENGY